MDKHDEQLLLKYLKKHFTPNQIKELLLNTSLKELRKNLAEIDIEYFALAYFPKYFDRPFGSCHRELFSELKTMINNKGQITSFILPREHGKSTILNFLVAMYTTVYKISQFTLIVSATEQIAQPFIDMIKDELVNNPLIKEDFGIVKGDRWNNNEIWIKGNNGIDSCIMIRGIDGSLRGVHYKHLRPVLVLLDDLLKEDTATSETKREQIKDTFKSVIIPIGTKESNIFIVGTVLHEEDLISDFKNGKVPGVKSIFKSAIESFADREDLWLQWEKLYNNLEDENRIETAKEFYLKNKDEMLKETKVLWHEYYSYYDMMVKKQRMGEKNFYKEMQNNPRNSSDYPFQNIHYWDKLPDLNELDLVMMIDPSLGKNNKSDFTAIVTLGRHRKTGQMYVIDGDIRRIKPHELIKLVSEKLTIYPVNNLGVETVQFQSLLFDDLKKHLISQRQYVIMTPINTKTNKETRIMGLENSLTQGYIKFNRDNTAFNRQIMDYCGKASKFDDAPDALALGVFLLDKGNQSIKTLPSNSLFGRGG